MTIRNFAALGLGLAASVGACSVSDADPNRSGVYACGSALPCPGDQTCVLGTCYTAEPPALEILSPEDQQPFPFVDGGPPLTVSLSVAGSGLDLVDPSEDPDREVGLGHVVIEVDGEEQMTLTNGQLETGVTAEITVANTPGGHRIVAIARLSDGITYDTPDAVVSQVFWIDDGRQHVVIKSPLPRTEFPLEAVRTDIEVAALNFSLMQTDVDPEPLAGHIHIHYDKDLPTCTEDPACDADFVGIVAPKGPATSAVSSVRLPASAAGVARLVAVLRQPNHFPFRDTDGNPVWSSVEIERSPNAVLPDEDETDGAEP